VAKDYPVGEGAVKWVSTEWLEAHLGSKGLMILDCQPNIHDYVLEHIPGAVYMNEGLLRVPLRGMPGKWIPTGAVEPVFSRLGLRADLPVVVYTGSGAFKGWGDGLEQTMVAYSLARFGHAEVHVLDGGLDKWKAEGRSLSKVFPEAETSMFKAHLRSNLYVEYGEFERIKDAENVLVLDARPADVYEGQGPWIKPGHIPGAVNLPWASLMDENNKRLLKPDTEIKAILGELGVMPTKTVICSCGTGREATNEFILFKWYLGYPDVRIYEGSFTEWTSFPGNPTVTGKNPR
jgi:thiosulfate/3-mercaptopyruvate sulfurtransferase